MSRIHGLAVRRLLWVVALAFLCGLAVPSLASAAPAPTVVSLEFDDGTADQAQLGTMLQSAGMQATFFVNSGRIGTSGYMTLAQIQSLAGSYGTTGAGAGNEIGGHTVNHTDLPTVPAQDAADEICNDRVALLGDGFKVSDFAYPYGDETPALEQTVAGCGYNSARTIGGILSPTSCTGCQAAETIPPADPYDTQTPDSVTANLTLAQIESLVTQAPAGGWVQLTMHHICAQTTAGCDPTYSIDPTTLSSFLTWLQARVAAGTDKVDTVNQVMGTTVLPGVPGPTQPLPSAGNLLQNPSLENVVSGVPSCWETTNNPTNDGTAATTTDAHTGSVAEQLSITNYTSGDENLISQRDLNDCAPLAQAGHSYNFSTWYKTTGTSPAVDLIAYLRDSQGTWVYWTQDPTDLAASTAYTQSPVWTTPAVPASGSIDGNPADGVCPCTGISVGVSLQSAGTVKVDDLSLSDADTTPPTVSLTAPANNATVGGNVTLSANAADAEGVRSVDFMVNGNIVGTSTTPPYQATWNSKGSTGAMISVRATDTAGNITTTPLTTVNVDNTPLTTSTRQHAAQLRFGARDD